MIAGEKPIDLECADKDSASSPEDFALVVLWNMGSSGVLTGCLSVRRAWQLDYKRFITSRAESAKYNQIKFAMVREWSIIGNTDVIAFGNEDEGGKLPRFAVSTSRVKPMNSTISYYGLLESQTSGAYARSTSSYTLNRSVTIANHDWAPNTGCTPSTKWSGGNRLIDNESSMVKERSNYYCRLATDTIEAHPVPS
ncbi:hypothetical protein T265_00722 [Opisthorchis viverrini]|uniref:Uncharacterized protein n=1 Tax=Opisthorchis viverrini TaxID=6198 RepID=A0A075AC09_OPIVI|nr:hypothetical protein T265_00722 [Opisthorchis viverrini]KER33410.1 hypothetical protein T265_00722 [Opisthorchis viverrini]